MSTDTKINHIIVVLSLVVGLCASSLKCSAAKNFRQQAKQLAKDGWLALPQSPSLETQLSLESYYLNVKDEHSKYQYICIGSCDTSSSFYNAYTKAMQFSIVNFIGTLCSNDTTMFKAKMKEEDGQPTEADIWMRNSANRMQHVCWARTIAGTDSIDAVPDSLDLGYTMDNFPEAKLITSMYQIKDDVVTVKLYYALPNHQLNVKRTSCSKFTHYKY